MRLKIWRACLAAMAIALASAAGATEQRLAERLFFVPDPKANSIQFRMIVLAGSADETNAKEWGIAHYLEHLILTGRDATGGESAMRFFSDGGSNGFTTTTTTGYIHNFPASATDRKARLERLFSFYAARLRDFPITEAEATRERAVVLQEFEQRYSSSAFAEPGVRIAQFGYQDHPLGRAIIGTRETIMAFSIAEAKAFLARWYSRGNVFFVLSGPMDPEEVRAAYEAHVGVQPVAPAPARTWQKTQVDLTPATLMFDHRDRRIAQESAFLSRVVAFPELDKIRSYAVINLLSLYLNSKLPGSPHSRLVEGDAPLASRLGRVGLNVSVPGVMGVSIDAVVEEGQSLALLRDTLSSVLSAIAADGISQAVLDRLKRRIAQDIARTKQEPAARFRELISWLSAELPPETLNDWPNAVADVSLDRFNAALKAIAQPGRDALVTFGPPKD